MSDDSAHWSWQYVDQILFVPGGGGMYFRFILYSHSSKVYNLRATNCWNTSKILGSKSWVKRRVSKVVLYFSTCSWCCKVKMIILENPCYSIQQNIKWFINLTIINTCWRRPTVQRYQGVLKSIPSVSHRRKCSDKIIMNLWKIIVEK